MHYPADRTGPIEKIYQLKTMINPKVDVVRSLLILHGCTIDEEGTQGPECTVIFPEGTTRQELWPRTMSARFRILLPDGFELREVDDRKKRTSLFLVVW